MHTWTYWRVKADFPTPPAPNTTIRYLLGCPLFCWAVPPLFWFIVDVDVPPPGIPDILTLSCSTWLLLSEVTAWINQKCLIYVYNSREETLFYLEAFYVNASSNLFRFHNARYNNHFVFKKCQWDSLCISSLRCLVQMKRNYRYFLV